MQTGEILGIIFGMAFIALGMYMMCDSIRKHDRKKRR